MSEIKTSPMAPMPKGYAFLPRGIQYKTFHCRKLTHAAHKPLYIVIDGTTILGLRAPRTIIKQVHAQANVTLSGRRAAVQKRDATDLKKAMAELDRQLPKAPEEEKESVVKHGFRKSSGRVGRTSKLELEAKVLLAVLAHVRHRHTSYDALLRMGLPREEARKKTRVEIESIVKKWGFNGDLNRYFKTKIEHGLDDS